jgi:hypothetical protein
LTPAAIPLKPLCPNVRIWQIPENRAPVVYITTRWRNPLLCSLCRAEMSILLHACALLEETLARRNGASAIAFPVCDERSRGVSPMRAFREIPMATPRWPGSAFSDPDHRCWQCVKPVASATSDRPARPAHHAVVPRYHAAASPVSPASCCAAGRSCRDGVPT